MPRSRLPRRALPGVQARDGATVRDRAARPRADPTRAAAIGLLGAAALWRLLVLALPGLAEPNYEEALVGLMARHILRGDFITFWWGHPCLGTVDVYVVFALFGWLGASTPVRRLAPSSSPWPPPSLPTCSPARCGDCGGASWPWPAGRCPRHSCCGSA